MSRWLLASAILGSAMAVGAVHTVTLCIVTAVLGAAAVVGWWGAAPLKPRPAATLLLFTGVGLTLYTVIQCIPLPVRWLTVVAPRNADVWSRALTPLAEPGPSWAPISLDPIATHVEVLKGVAYLLAFVAALRIARKREGVTFLGATLVMTGLALTVAALLHPAFGARELFGVYAPTQDVTASHIAPLMDPNNLAGYINVAFCVALAASIEPEARVPRVIAAAIALLLAAAQVWVASRGGVASGMLGALLVFAVARIAAQKHHRQALQVSLLIGLVAAAGLIMTVLGSSDRVSNELFEADASKLGFFVQAMRMLPSYGVLGTGRGAFESTFPAFRQMPGHVTLTHPENVFAQWTVEWGVPVGLTGLLLIAIALRPHTALARLSTAGGAWAAMAALATQNLVDLGSEIPGLMLAPVVCAAIVVAGTAGREPRRRIEKWSAVPNIVAAVACLASVAAIVLAAPGIGRGLDDDRRTLRDVALRRNSSREAVDALARTAMARHPAEPYLPFITGVGAVLRMNESPIPWLGATLERAPVYGPAHFVLARVVARQSPSQARMEYRLAVQQAPELTDPVVLEAQRLVGGYYDATELVPEGKPGVRVLDGLIPKLAERLPSSQVRLDRDLVARAPADAGPYLRAATEAVEDLEAGESAPWCDGPARAACIKAALISGERARERAGHRCLPYALLARTRIAAGDVRVGLQELSDAADVVDDRTDCLRTLEQISQAAGDEARATQAIDRLASAGCTEDADCARDLSWAADIEWTRGNKQRALVFLKRAQQRAPEDEALVERAARLASELGLHAESADDYGRLERRHPADPRWAQSAAEERSAAMRSVVRP